MKKGFLKDYVLDPTSPSGYRYVGSYYYTSVPQEKRRRNGGIQLIGGVIELLFLLLAVSIPCQGNFKISVVIPAECILLCIVFYITGSYAYFRSPDKMEKNIYEKAFVRTVQVTAIGLVLNGVAFLAQCIVIFKNMENMEGYGDFLLLTMLGILFVGNLFVLKYHRRLYKQAALLSVEEEVTGNRD